MSSAIQHAEANWLLVVLSSGLTKLVCCHNSGSRPKPRESLSFLGKCHIEKCPS